jgi:hypothetical protein
MCIEYDVLLNKKYQAWNNEKHTTKTCFELMYFIEHDCTTSSFCTTLLWLSHGLECLGYTRYNDFIWESKSLLDLDLTTTSLVYFTNQLLT